MKGLCGRALAVVGVVIAAHLLLVFLVVSLMGPRDVVLSGNPRLSTAISMIVIAVLAVVGVLIVPALRGVRTFAAMAVFGLGLALAANGGSLGGAAGLGAALVSGLIGVLVCASIVARSGRVDGRLSKGIALAVPICVVLSIPAVGSMSGLPWVEYPPAILLLLPIGLAVPSLVVVTLRSASIFSASGNIPTTRSTIGTGVLLVVALAFGLAMASANHAAVLIVGVAFCIWPAVYAARLAGSDASSHSGGRIAILAATAALPYIVAAL